MPKRILLAILVLFVAPVTFAQDDAIHDELRGLLTGIESAVNEQRYGDIAQYFDENARITTINQEVMTSTDDIEPYFEHWFGEGGYLKTLKMTLNADALTELYADDTFGVVIGSGDEDYVLSDTRFFPMKTRWTATVKKGDDGGWRILTLHIGTNFLDNPILTMVEDSAKYTGVGGLVLGLLIGIVVGFIFGRRKQTF